jgi:hypothetical protein
MTKVAFRRRAKNACRQMPAMIDKVSGRPGTTLNTSLGEG